MFLQVTQLKASEQMHAVASEQQQKEANIKEALEEQLAQVHLLNYTPFGNPFFPHDWNDFTCTRYIPVIKTKMIILI